MQQQEMDDGSFRRCGLVLLVDTKTLDSNDKLTQLNLSLRSLWSSTMVVIKPWSRGIERAEDGMFPTSSIPHIANRISQGIRRLPKLLRTQCACTRVVRSSATDPLPRPAGSLFISSTPNGRSNSSNWVEILVLPLIPAKGAQKKS